MARMGGTADSAATSSDYMRGAMFGLAAVSIWAGNIVVAGLGLKSSLTVWDISAIRFGVAGVLLAPYLLRQGLAFDRLGWIGLAALVLGGAPAVLLANAGLLFAPAAHAGALFPGVMPLMVAILAAVLLKEPFTAQKRAGFAFITIGVVGIVWGAGGSIGTSQNLGHLLFLGAAFSWACYTVAMRRARLDGLHAAAISAVGSTLLYLPPYALAAGGSMFEATLGAIALQALVQGLLTAVIFLSAVWNGGRHSWCVQRCCIRGSLSRDDSPHGYTDPRRVAFNARLDGHRAHLDWRLHRQRWTVTWAAT
jgi:drug/metabolite transporter (DMT)-like permease